MYRNLFGLAAVLVGAGYFLRSLPSAEAQSLGPVVSLGEAPWKSFTGYIAAGATDTVYAVPSDQIFVMTGACLNESQTNIYEDSTLKVDSRGMAAHCSNSHLGMLGLNNAHIVFEGGSELILEANGSDPVSYTILGYLAQP